MSLLSAVASLPKYETVLPDSGLKVQYRPFIMKEEKILLMAAETKNEKTIYNSLREVILACTSNTLDIMTISAVDLEYLFLQLRINSVGNRVNPSIKCEFCDDPNEVEISLSDIKVSRPAEQNSIVKLSPEITVHMKNISIKNMMAVRAENEMEKAFETIALCIDKVYIKDNLYDSKDYTTKEMVEFVEGLMQSQMILLFKFIENVPKMEAEVDFKCKKCSQDNHMILRGITSFF